LRQARVMRSNCVIIAGGENSFTQLPNLQAQLLQ
jgi:hypothetical protein